VQIDYSFSDGNTGSQGPGGALTASGHIAVGITATNDAPDLTPNAPTAVTYVEGQTSPVALLATGAVTDPDNPANFNGGNLTVAIGSAQGGDEIVLLGSSPFTDNAGTLMDGLTAIGTVTGLGTSSVSVSLNAGATPSEVDKLTESFGFETTSASTADRTVTFTFKDGGNTGGTAPGLSDNVSQTVHVAGPADAQLYFRINQGNDVQLGDINSSGTGLHTIYTGGGIQSSPSPGGNGNETSVAVDTAAGLVFSVGKGNAGSFDAFSVHNLYTGALIETVAFGPNTGSANTDDVVQALTIDPYTHTLYVGDWGTTTATTGVAEFTYNPANGLVTPAGPNGSTALTESFPGNPTVTTTTGGYLFTAAQTETTPGTDATAQYTNANAFYLDTTNHLLYYVDDDSGYNISPYHPTNGVYVVSTTGPNFNPIELTSNGSGAGQFAPANQPGTFVGPHGNLIGLAVDVADGIVFFESTDVQNSANNALWWVSTTGGANQTAHKVLLPSGVTLNFAGQSNEGGDAAGLSFDAQTKQLYLSNAYEDGINPDLGSIYVLQWDNTNKTVSLATSFDTATLVGTTAGAVNPFDAPSATTLDILPVLAPLTATATHAVEQSAAVTLLTGAPTITDADGDHLASATVQITGGTFSSNENSTADDHLGFAAADVTGNQINGTSITFSYNSASETLTLTGYDTLANYQTALSEVQYFTTGNNPTNYGLDPTRTITWQVNDGAIGNPVAANTGTSFISIDAVNDAPSNTAPAATLTVNEDTSLALTGGNTISVSDPDNQSLTVTLTAANGTVTLGSVTNLTVTGTNGSGSVAISGTIADVNAALATLSYKGNANYFGADTVTVDSFDGIAHTQSTIHITVNPVNDAPVLDLDANDSSGAVNADYQATFTIGGSGVAIADADTSITDVDNTTLASATITLTNHQANDLLSVNGTLPASITASSYNAATGVLTLTGTGATLADFQTALHEITFSNSSATPGFTDRVVTVVVDDGQGVNHVSNVATATIHMGTQIAPVITSVVAATAGNVTDLDANQVVTITVSFNTAVNVTGTPALQLNDSEFAGYTGGTGSSALTFSYTVQPGDNTADLQVQSLLLNGGTLKDGAGNDAVLTNAATDLHLQVDTTAPTVSVAANSTTLLAGQTAVVTFTFSEAIQPFALADTSVTGGVLSNLFHVGINGSNQDIYTATFTPNVTNTEAGSVQVTGLSYSDVAGNAGAASNTVSLTGDTLAPAAPTLALLFDTGISSTDHITNNPTITYSTPALGDTFLYKVDGGGFSATVPIFATDHSADGPHTVSVEEVDAAGNISTPASLSFTLDTVAPGAPTLALAHDTGVSSTDNITSDPTITVTPAEGGGVLLYKADGAASFSATAPSFATDGSADGTHTVSVEQQDAAGNIGAPTSLSFTLVTIAPAAPTLALLFDTGISSADHITNNPTITFSTPALGDTFLYKVDGGGFSATVPTFATDHSADGSHTVSVEQQDAAGNIGAAASLSFTLDTVAPTVSIVADHTALLAGQTAALTFTFSEALSGFALTDTNVTGGALSNLVHVGLNGSSQDVYTAIFTPDASNTEVGSVQVTASSYTDVAGNAGAASNTLNFTGDTLAPTATTVTATTDNGHTDIDAGHVVTITLATSEAVTVTGTPTLTLNDGEHATYASGTGTTALTFSYTVAAGDNTPDLKVTGYGGTIQDLAGNSLAAVTGDLGIQVDTTAPTVTGITASPASGAVFAGSTVELMLGFDEAVNVTGGIPTLTLNDGASAVYDAAATALLGDASKLVFDYLVSANDPLTPSLAVTGLVPHGATVNDLAGNPADLSHVAAAFSALSINESVVPAYTIGGLTRPALELDSAGDIILDPAAAAAASAYGIKFLYAGLPASTPYPPVADPHDFHLI
jgi:hypothetical protein